MISVDAEKLCDSVARCSYQAQAHGRKPSDAGGFGYRSEARGREASLAKAPVRYDAGGPGHMGAKFPEGNAYSNR